MRRRRRANNANWKPEDSEKRIEKTMMRRNAMTILECSTAWAFRWYRNSFYCSYCDAKFVEPNVLREHVLQHLTESPTKRVFSKLRENNMIKIDISDWNCRLCGYRIESLDYLKEHLTSIHSKVFQEDFSDGVLPFKLELNGYHCQKCMMYFVSFANINAHMNTHYQNYICDACGKVFVSISRFRIHVQSHETGRFPCSCGEVFDTRGSRNSHNVRVHRKGVRYACPHCPDLFTTYYARIKHLVNVHPTLNTFNHDYDGKSFKRDLTHSVGRKYECPNCSCYFVSKSKLRKHVELTHQERPNETAV
ncbi:uncharacterized protein [Epargyreus clarus]|uniref:uncharacterized protein n=1 Tax=Epargyreus clarus TaxID=520877 RepID=UPI003C2B1003